MRKTWSTYDLKVILSMVNQKCRIWVPENITSIFKFWTSAKLDKETSFKILDRFVELGGNFIDTANAYSEGQSEEIIGEWMKE